MMADGTFVSESGEFRLENAPAWTQEMYDQFAELAAKAKEDKLSANEIIAEVAGISPEIAQKLASRNLPSAVLILLLIIMLKNCSMNVSVDVNRLIDQAIHAAGGTIAPVAGPPSGIGTPSQEVAPPDISNDSGSISASRVAMIPDLPSRRAQRRARGRAKGRFQASSPPSSEA